MFLRSKKIRIFAIPLIFTCLVLCMNVVSMEAGGCEDAFMRCIYDPFILMNTMTGGIYCGAGYLFCKKYIEPSK